MTPVAPVQVKTAEREGLLAQRLEFRADAGSLSDAAMELLDAGAQSFLLLPFDREAADLAVRLRARAAQVRVLAANPVPGVDTNGVTIVAAGDLAADVTILYDTEPEALSRALADRVDSTDGVVLALEAGRRVNALPVFLISVPKAGTHLAINLLNSLGYNDGGPCPNRPQRGYWYYLEYSNAHTAAPDFFVDTVRRQPFGNRAHPFARSPVLFMYRHPLDILVSESKYYPEEGATPFAAYLADLPEEERVLRLIDDPRLLGSLRERILKFAAWLDFPNVMPVSYEELVGVAGGGDDKARDRLLWSLLLKLQLAGAPRELARRISRRDSPTFREGRVGEWTRALSSTARRMIDAQPSDFLELFGYAESSAAKGSQIPVRAAAYRRRPLVLSRSDFKDTPILVETHVFGHNIVDFGGKYYAVPVSSGPLDLSSLSEDALRAFASDVHLPGLRQALLRQQIRSILETDSALDIKFIAILNEQLEAHGAPDRAAARHELEAMVEAACRRAMQSVLEAKQRRTAGWLPKLRTAAAHLRSKLGRERAG